MKICRPLFALLATTTLTTACTTSHPDTVSRLEIYDITHGRRTVVKEFPFTIEAPNWSRDGKWLIYNSDGRLWRIAPDGKGEPECIDTDTARHCNNDHCLSFDGMRMAVSSGTDTDWRSRIWTLPMDGGTATLITPHAPSYLHGWSPDGRWLTYCAERDGAFDVYMIPAEGGEEVRLTDAPGLDDGPEYTPDGTYIWFCSVRSGLMQLWRMRDDGSEQQQMTFDTDRNTWFPHVSPDGKHVVSIAYRCGDLEPGEHLPGKHVELRLMAADGGENRTLTTLYGGQGTINVNSWSPDSRRFAFVSYVEKDEEQGK